MFSKRCQRALILGLTLIIATPCFAQFKKKKKKQEVEILQANLVDPIDNMPGSINYSYSKKGNLIYISRLYVKLCDGDLFEKPLEKKDEVDKRKKEDKKDNEDKKDEINKTLKEQDYHYSKLGVNPPSEQINLFAFPSTAQATLYFQTSGDDPSCIKNIIVQFDQMTKAQTDLKNAVAESLIIQDKELNELTIDNGLKRTLNAIYYVLKACKIEIEKAQIAVK